jgi:hypothetical protein
LANLQGKIQRDGELTTQLESFRQRIERLAPVLGADAAEWLALRYLLEEVRVGLFAERLGVREKASPKRLDRQLESLEREHGLI